MEEICCLLNAPATPVMSPGFSSIGKQLKKSRGSSVLATPTKAVTSEMVSNNVSKRSLLLQSAASATALLLYASPAHSAPLAPMKDTDIIRSLKLKSGVKIQDIVEGQGAEAQEGDLVEFNYVCRRSNGYFVHSTVDQFSGESRPVVLPLDENQMIQGLKEVLVGMKVGGKRRALIPPIVGYVTENLQPIPDEFGPRRSLQSHMNEPLVFEVQLLKVL